MRHHRLAASGLPLNFLLVGCAHQLSDQACRASIKEAHDLNPEGYQDCVSERTDSLRAREGHQGWITSQAPDHGLFLIDFWTDDNCDPNPVIVALLWVQGLSYPIQVSNGQIIEFEVEDEGSEIEYEDGILEIEAPSITLRVTASDASGNEVTVDAQPIGLDADNDVGDDDD